MAQHGAGGNRERRAGGRTLLPPRLSCCHPNSRPNRCSDWGRPATKPVSSLTSWSMTSRNSSGICCSRLSTAGGLRVHGTNLPRKARRTSLWRPAWHRRRVLRKDASATARDPRGAAAVVFIVLILRATRSGNRATSAPLAAVGTAPLSRASARRQTPRTSSSERAACMTAPLQNGIASSACGPIEVESCWPFVASPIAPPFIRPPPRFLHRRATGAPSRPRRH